MTIRHTIEQVAELPPALAAALGIFVLALIVLMAWGLLRLPDHTRLSSPEARERARRRTESRRRQQKLRARRESLQRRPRRRWTRLPPCRTTDSMTTAGEERAGAALDAGEHPGDHVLGGGATLELDLAAPSTILGDWRRAVEDGRGVLRAASSPWQTPTA
ncbi:hypothetical protein [Streptomyces diastaticus]|uniref:hypothetical protein n=1 Tax=Streptomyces diastaticus TaxID=1956 RepID=UPI0035DE1D07